jgi:predicted nucleic acid-binding protein
MIYFDSSALLKFVKPEKESPALREWRVSHAADSELVTSQLAVLEISRTLLRAGVDHQRVPYVSGQAVRGLFLVDVTSTVLTRARSYGIRRLGSLDAIHLATADPFLAELTGFVTYDAELAAAAGELGLPVASPA